MKGLPIKPYERVYVPGRQLPGVVMDIVASRPNHPIYKIRFIDPHRAEQWYCQWYRRQDLILIKRKPWQVTS